MVFKFIFKIENIFNRQQNLSYLMQSKLADQSIMYPFVVKESPAALHSSVSMCINGSSSPILSNNYSDLPVLQRFAKFKQSGISGD